METKHFRKVNEPFVCENCKKEVLPTVKDTYRNHCPFCLHSKHVDNLPGDRENGCEGLLVPIGLEILSGGDELRLLFCCKRCGAKTKNKMALKTPIQPDNYDLAITLHSRLR